MKIDIEGSEPLALSEKAAAEYFANNKIQYLLTEANSNPKRFEYFRRLNNLGY